MAPTFFYLSSLSSFFAFPLFPLFCLASFSHFRILFPIFLSFRSFHLILSFFFHFLPHLFIFCLSFFSRQQMSELTWGAFLPSSIEVAWAPPKIGLNFLWQVFFGIQFPSPFYASFFILFSFFTVFCSHRVILLVLNVIFLNTLDNLPSFSVI